MSCDIIIVSGLDRVGKSTVGKLLALNDTCLFECGEYIRQKIIHDEFGTASSSKYYDTNMERFNIEIIEEMLLKMELRPEGTCLVVVGVRSSKLLESILELPVNVYVVYVQSEFDRRYSRHVYGNKNKFICSKRQFEENDELQYTWGIGEIKSMANVIISNNSSHEELLNLVKKIKASAC